MSDEYLSGFVVRIPMMPKGVEHSNPESIQQVSGRGENSDDAERR
ncbi:MAG: hypothetical protein ABR568_19485 [Pyrinomonadaceae bacterium]